MRKRLVVMSMVAALFVGSIAASGQGRGNGRGRGQGNGASQNDGKAPAASVAITFGKDNERLIRDWFKSRSNLKGLPPGLAKKEKLPPGLEKQLIRNGTLPPGLEKKLQPLPPDLEVRLPRLPDGHRRVIISGTVVLLQEYGSKILDVLVKVY